MNHCLHCWQRGACRWFALTCLFALVAGCGRGNSNLAPVTGKVTYNGELVTGGTLIFSPVGGESPGKPATAEIRADGTYVLTTDEAGDGGRIGPQTVSFTPPEQELTEEQRTNPNYIAPPPRYAQLVPKEPQVEIKAGDNLIDIELLRAAFAARR